MDHSDDEEMNPSGNEDNRMNPSGYEDNRMNPSGYEDNRMEDNRMNPSGYEDNRMNPSGYEDNRMNPSGYEDNRMNPTGYEDNRQDNLVPELPSPRDSHNANLVPAQENFSMASNLQPIYGLESPTQYRMDTTSRADWEVPDLSNIRSTSPNRNVPLIQVTNQPGFADIQYNPNRLAQSLAVSSNEFANIPLSLNEPPSRNSEHRCGVCSSHSRPCDACRLSHSQCNLCQNSQSCMHVPLFIAVSNSSIGAPESRPGQNVSIENLSIGVPPLSPPPLPSVITPVSPNSMNDLNVTPQNLARCSETAPPELLDRPQMSATQFFNSNQPPAETVFGAVRPIPDGNQTEPEESGFNQARATGSTPRKCTPRKSGSGSSTPRKSGSGSSTPRKSSGKSTSQMSASGKSVAVRRPLSPDNSPDQARGLPPQNLSAEPPTIGVRRPITRSAIRENPNVDQEEELQIVPGESEIMNAPRDNPPVQSLLSTIPAVARAQSGFQEYEEPSLYTSNQPSFPTNIQIIGDPRARPDLPIELNRSGTPGCRGCNLQCDFCRNLPP